MLLECRWAWTIAMLLFDSIQFVRSDPLCSEISAWRMVQTACRDASAAHALRTQRDVAKEVGSTCLARYSCDWARLYHAVQIGPADRRHHIEQSYYNRSSFLRHKNL